MHNYIFKFIFLLLIILLRQHSLDAKRYELKKFVCADQIGPRVEFTLPNFINNNKKTLFKIFDNERRELSYEQFSELKKVKSIIDDSYFFYVAEIALSQNGDDKIYFEFFPPSTMMIKVNQSQFKNLACWTI